MPIISAIFASIFFFVIVPGALVWLALSVFDLYESNRRTRLYEEIIREMDEEIQRLEKLRKKKEQEWLDNYYKKQKERIDARKREEARFEHSRSYKSHKTNYSEPIQETALSKYYKLLGVPENSTKEQIRTAYRQLALKYHPDKNKSKEAESIMKQLNEALEMLR